MSNYLKCAALTIALAGVPVAANADTIGYSYNVWQDVCDPALGARGSDPDDCFTEAINFYASEFVPNVLGEGVELHCHDISTDMFWKEIHETQKAFKGYILDYQNDWRYVISQLIFYHAGICPVISE